MVYLTPQEVSRAGVGEVLSVIFGCREQLCALLTEKR